VEDEEVAKVKKIGKRRTEVIQTNEEVGPSRGEKRKHN